MAWTELLERGRRKIHDAAVTIPQRRADERWASFALAVRAAAPGLSLASPDRPQNFTDATRRWEAVLQTPLDPAVTIRLTLVYCADPRDPRRDFGWEVEHYRDQWGYPAPFIVPTFCLVREGEGPERVEWCDRSQWLYADDLETAAALAEKSFENLTHLLAIQKGGAQ